MFSPPESLFSMGQAPSPSRIKFSALLPSQDLSPLVFSSFFGLQLLSPPASFHLHLNTHNSLSPWGRENPQTLFKSPPPSPAAALPLSSCSPPRSGKVCSRSGQPQFQLLPLTLSVCSHGNLPCRTADLSAVKSRSPSSSVSPGHHTCEHIPLALMTSRISGCSSSGSSSGP